MSKSENPLHRLGDFGQSVWLDYIRRDLLSSAEFRRMIDEDGLKGMTSNPTIFEKAIDGSPDYDDQFAELARAGRSVAEIYEALTTDDIKAARRYWKLIDRPNLMIKVPATPAGIPAVEQLLSEGHNINITLMFSLKH